MLRRSTVVTMRFGFAPSRVALSRSTYVSHGGQLGEVLAGVNVGSDAVNSKREKDIMRLRTKQHLKGVAMEFHLCKKCGMTTTTAGFSRTPSARLGMFGRCAADLDYTHHHFVPLTADEHSKLEDIPREQRVSIMLWDKDDSKPT
jgi:hypothetical protein